MKTLSKELQENLKEVFDIIMKTGIDEKNEIVRNIDLNFYITHFSITVYTNNGIVPFHFYDLSTKEHRDNLVKGLKAELQL